MKLNKKRIAMILIFIIGIALPFHNFVFTQQTIPSPKLPTYEQIRQEIKQITEKGDLTDEDIARIQTLTSLLIQEHHSPPPVIIEPGSGIESASYIIFKDDEGWVYAKNGSTGAIEFRSTDASYVIQSAIDALTSGRTWKEKVMLKGNFSINSKITIPNYTVLDLSAARLTLANNVNDDMFLINGSSNIVIFGGNLQGNYANQIGGSAIHIDSNPTDAMIVIQDMDIRDFYNHGIHAENGFELQLLNNNLYSYFGGNVLHLTGMQDLMVIGNHIENGAMGIRTYDVLESYFIANEIVHNTYGMDVEGSDAAHAYQVIIVGNEISHSTRHGLRIGGYASHGTIIGNHIYNNDVDNTISWDGINIRGNASYWTIMSNRIRENDRYEINIESSDCVKNELIGNIVVGSDHEGTIVDSGTDTVIRYNIGFATENSGTSTVANDENITHGLATTPSIVTITSMNSTYSDEPVIVSWIDSNTTHFQTGVYWANGTAITDDVISISWYAEV